MAGFTLIAFVTRQPSLSVHRAQQGQGSRAGG
jgi:hypothetical protein